MEDNVSLFLAIEKLVQDKMFFHQGLRVVKDVDLAEILEVDIKELRMGIRKNRKRFPPDFMTEINDGEFAFLPPGIIMMGGLLKSERAIKAHRQFVRCFVGLAHINGISIFDLVTFVR